MRPVSRIILHHLSIGERPIEPLRSSWIFEHDCLLRYFETTKFWRFLSFFTSYSQRFVEKKILYWTKQSLKDIMIDYYRDIYEILNPSFFMAHSLYQRPYSSVNTPNLFSQLGIFRNIGESFVSIKQFDPNQLSYPLDLRIANTCLNIVILWCDEST